MYVIPKDFDKRLGTISKLVFLTRVAFIVCFFVVVIYILDTDILKTHPSYSHSNQKGNISKMHAAISTSGASIKHEYRVNVSNLTMPHEDIPYSSETSKHNSKENKDSYRVAKFSPYNKRPKQQYLESEMFNLTKPNGNITYSSEISKRKSIKNNASNIPVLSLPYSKSTKHVNGVFNQTNPYDGIQYANETSKRNNVSSIVATFSPNNKSVKPGYHVNEVLNLSKSYEDIIPYPPEESKKYFIYYCVSGQCGGLSDREKGMVISYIIAYVTDSKFEIKVRVPSENCSFSSFYNKNKITWDIDQRELEGLSNMTFLKLDNPLFIRRMKTIDFGKLFVKDIVYFKANLHYWKSFSENKLYRDKLKSMANLTEDQLYASLLPRILPLSDILQRQLDEFLSIAKPQDNSRLICGQIRRAKNPMNIEGGRKLLLFLKQFMSSTNDRIFIASDRRPFRDMAAKMFDKQYVNVARKTVHVDHLQSESPGVCQGYELAILEQRILSKCDVLLITFSGYGRLAAYMRNRNEDLYCYKDGFILPCKTENLLNVYGLPSR